MNVVAGRRPRGFLQAQVLGEGFLGWRSSLLSFFFPRIAAPQEVPARSPEDLHLLRAQLRQVLQLQEAPQGAREAAQR